MCQFEVVYVELIVPFWAASLNWLVFAYISCVNHCHMLCGDSFLPDICPYAVDSCSSYFLVIPYSIFLGFTVFLLIVVRAREIQERMLSLSKTSTSSDGA